MSWGTVIKVGATLVTSYLGNRAAKKGANAQAGASDAATEEQRRQFDIAREDQMPWLEAGRDALGQMQRLNAGDFSSFNISPDYQFARDQGLQSLERGAAARGGFMGGGADADRMSFASGLASQNYNNFYNRLAGLSGTAQSSASNLGQMGMNMATNIGNNLTNAAAARASSYASQANTWNNAIEQGANAFGSWYGQRGGRN